MSTAVAIVKSAVLAVEPTIRPPTLIIDVLKGKVCADPNVCPTGGIKLKVPAVSISRKPWLLLTKSVPLDLIVMSPPGCPTTGT
jgi:hypothetical protein